MNRRKFFGMTAAALTAVGLPLSLLPEKTIFLPPTGGLWMPPTIREVEQYLINTDSLAMRWDIAWELLGERSQYFVQSEPKLTGLEQAQMGEDGLAKYRLWQRENARKQLAQMVPIGAKVIVPPLPRGLMYAAHV